MIVKQSDIRAALRNKLCGEGSFIQVPEGAEYSAEDATNVVLHAATSSSNSIEAKVAGFTGDASDFKDSMCRYCTYLHERE